MVSLTLLSQLERAKQQSKKKHNNMEDNSLVGIRIIFVTILFDAYTILGIVLWSNVRWCNCQFSAVVL
jgi:hypothetical protein